LNALCTFIPLNILNGITRKWYLLDYPARRSSDQNDLMQEILSAVALHSSYCWIVNQLDINIALLHKR